MLFRLCNTAQTFQRFIDAVTRGFPFDFSCIDEFLVFSNDAKQHYQLIRELFSRFAENGGIVNKAKCEFGAHDVGFIDYHVDKNGIRPLPFKMYAL